MAAKRSRADDGPATALAPAARPVWEWSLPELEAHELDLLLRIEQLNEEISDLEKDTRGSLPAVAVAPSSANGPDDAPEEAVEDTAACCGWALTELMRDGAPRMSAADEMWEAPDWCVPIKANVLMFDWEVALGYDQLPDVCIENLPIPSLSNNGFIFIWVINAKYAKAFDLMKRWGYTYVDSIDWVKLTVNRRLAKGHGYYLQHAKETCLVGKKGQDPPGCKHGVGSDVIFAERRGQSQKPEEIYELIEELVPNGRYLEIFARRNNLRDYWVSIGNEL